MNMLKTCMAVMFHPISAFEYVVVDKDKKRMYVEACALWLIVIASRIISIYITHDPLATINPREARLSIEIAKQLVPFLTWVTACYGVTSIMEGETTLQETLIGSAYAMTPYIVFTVLLAILSNILSTRQIGFYRFLESIVWIWVFFLYFIGLKTMNDYTFKKSIGTFLLILLGMLIIWALTILLFALTVQFFSFISDFYLEIKILLLDGKW